MKNKLIYLILFIYAIISCFIILFFDGTGDSGDSIHHYLYARYAPLHPKLFFDHWAKPLYVLLASPFAQFGIIGIKIFNAIVSLLTIFFTFKVAELLNLKHAIISAVILIFSPLFFVLTFSGLTEPLFALFISISLYAILKDQFVFACIIVSFLPFIRSEGLIIVGVFALYFLIKKEWKILPFIAVGHIVYSIAGYFVYHDLFWVFNKIPYARLSSAYGSGTLFHFVEQLIYVIGIPIYILFWLGVIGIIWKSIKKTITVEIQILVFLGFLSFFIAHTLFWYLGIFNSMGLKRVLVGIMPFIAIISLIGFNTITEDILKNKKTPKLIFQGLLLAYIFIFPFTPNPAALDIERDLSLSKDQELAKDIADYISQNKLVNHRFVFSHPYLSEVLQVDYFNSEKHLEFSPENISKLKSGDIIIWENWFALVENGIAKQSLDSNSELLNLYDIAATEKGGHEVSYSVYQRK